MRGSLTVLAVCLLGCEAAAPTAATDVGEPAAAAASGPGWRRHDVTDFAHRNGEEREVNSIVESVGGGVAVFDYDLDGVLDVAAAGGGTFDDAGDASIGYPTGLLRGRGGWQYAEAGDQAGVDAAGHYTHGLAVSDPDNDGFADLLVTGYGGVTYWRNLGDGTFEDATAAAGLDAGGWSTSAGFGDLNGDGLSDLYLARYVDWSPANDPHCEGRGGVEDVCSPRSFRGLDDALYLNDGRGGFREAGGLEPGGKGLGVVLADLDLDGDLDVYVGNDSTPNFLYVNDGAGGLSERGLAMGASLDDRGHPDGSMGVDVADYDLDGRPDVWVANYEAEAFGLYRNAGPAGFLYATREAGVASIGDLFVGFGTAFGDFDLDGDPDIVVSNGHVVQTARQSPIRQQPLYLENDGGRFTRVSYDTGYFAGSVVGRGLATGDLDNDGDLDLALSNENEPLVLLENLTPRQGGTTVRLVTTSEPRDATGVTVSVGGAVIFVTGGGSYLSHSDRRLRLLGDGGDLPADWTRRRVAPFASQPENQSQVVAVRTDSDSSVNVEKRAGGSYPEPIGGR